MACDDQELKQRGPTEKSIRPSGSAERSAIIVQYVSDSKLHRHWPWLAVLLCAGLLVALAWMQFVWTDQLSEAQAQMMGNALANSLRQFSARIEQEAAGLLRAFQVDPRVSGAIWTSLAARRELWSQVSDHGALLERLLFGIRDESGQVTFHEMPPGSDILVKATDQESLAALENFIEGSADLEEPGWVIVPEARAIIRRLGVPFRAGRRTRALPDGAGGGYLALVVDWTYVTESLLPKLVDRLFGGRDGSALYQVAVATRRKGTIVFRSDPAINADWFASADRRRPVRFAGPRLPLRRPPDDPAAEQRGQALGPRGGTEPSGSQITPGRFRPLQRLLPVTLDGEPFDGLRIAATHVSGSLEAVVERQRRRNLAAGMGVLLLLAGATALVIVSARRASRLAAMQMEFVAGVSHELRTPLAVICSVGDNLADGVVQGVEPVRRYGELIRDQGRRLADMIEQTLQLAALESRKAMVQVSEMDPASAVRMAVDDARPMIDQAGFALEQETEPGLPRVLANPDAVQRVLANLLGNAVKHGEAGRWVRVETTFESNSGSREVRIQVKDRGPGIPAGEAERVFDAFYRGSEATEAGIMGSGLGLKLALDLARGMGGKLSCHSEPGLGSVFTLHLPVAGEGTA